MEKGDFFEINQAALRDIIRKEKVILLSFILLTAVGSILFAFYKKDEFLSSGRILPEIQTSKLGNLSQFAGLASLAGVDLNSATGSEAVRPDLYPNILKSTPFYMNLFKIKVQTKDNRSLIFEEFYFQYVEDKEKPKPEKISKFKVKADGIIIINRLTEDRIKDLNKRINAEFDKKSGIISIVVKMPDPVVAAEVTRYAMQYLTDYVTNYRTEKARRDVEFLADQVTVSKGRYYNNQQRKANYSDQFQAATMRFQASDVQRERLETEYRMSSSFYNELLKKYEEAKIKLQHETPVFKILDPPVVPTRKSEPKRSIIIIVLTFLGGIFGLMIVLLKGGNYKKVFV